jgi:ABC-type methionine transport system ATPase subunit
LIEEDQIAARSAFAVSPPAFTLKAVRQVKDEVSVVDVVDLEIAERKVTAIVGSSGAGKTSLLRLLNRLDDPVSGEIFYRERLIKQYNVRELRHKVGFVFQTPVMFSGTVRDNLREAAILSGKTSLDLDRRIEEALKLAEFDVALSERDGSRLSVGQKQRVNIARALMTSPDVLLMDEPTSALDPTTADRLIDTVKQLAQEHGLTVVMITHRLTEAQRGSDTTIMMERGRIVETGATVRLFEQPADPRSRAFLGESK